MTAEGTGGTYGPTSADAYELELDQVTGGTEPTPTLAVTQARHTAPASPVGADPFDTRNEDTELEEAHEVLDALGAGGRDQTLVERLRSFIERAAGECAVAALNPGFGAALAPCRQARLMR